MSNQTVYEYESEPGRQGDYIIHEYISLFKGRHKCQDACIKAGFTTLLFYLT